MKYLLTLIIVIFTLVKANFNVYDFDDKAKEEHFYSLIKELRCPRCQNNNLADSNAPLATDIKKYVYHSIKDGKTNKEITDFLVSRYGEFIIYRPRNIIIWIIPTAIGIIALLLAIISIYKSRKKNYINDKLNIPNMATIINKYESEKNKND